MKLKNKKRAMMILLSALLTTTSCHKQQEEDESYKINSFAKIQEIMDTTYFYTGTMSYRYDSYANFYQTFLDHFIEYLDRDQYEQFLDVVKMMNKSENYSYPQTIKRLNRILGTEKNAYGYGFYNAFTTCLLDEKLDTSNSINNNNPYRHINTLKAIINNDPEFLTSLFSCDIDAVIDCIVKNTGLTDRTLVEELILKLDLYTELIESAEYHDEELKENYEERITEIMGIIINSKCQTNRNFNRTLYAQLLKKSEYYNIGTYRIEPKLLGDTFELSAHNETKSYITNISSEYLYSDKTIEEIEKIKVNMLISDSFKSSKSSYDNTYITMSLIFHLVDFEALQDITGTDNEIRLKIYDNLKEYFADEAEFNSFILNINSRSTEYLYFYFDILNKQLKKAGITYEDFVRYLSFENLNNLCTYVYYYRDIDREYPPSDELEKMKKEEYENIISTSLTNYIFSNIDYKTCLDMLKNTLSEGDLGFEMLYGPECELYLGSIPHFFSGNNCVISYPVNPKTIKYNNMDVIYYEIPEYYEDGNAVDAFVNIENKLITIPVEGFKTNIKDPSTGEEKLIIIVGVGKNTEDYEPIRYIEYYKYFQEKQKENVKTRSLGGINE